MITEFPRLGPSNTAQFKPNPKPWREPLTGYVAQSQLPGFTNDPRWLNLINPQFITDLGLHPAQVPAGSNSRPASASEGNDHFLMAAGTGKTLVAAAVIKLLRTGNARHPVLVDRIELENQALQNFDLLLKRITRPSLQRKPAGLAQSRDRG